jgi:hypothetical protein
MVVDWDEAEPLEEDEDGEPQTWKQRLFKRFHKLLPVKT